MTDKKKKSEDEVTAEQSQEGVSSESASGSDTIASASEAELVQLRQELDKKEHEARQNYDRFVRQLAEFENFKKRTAREKEESIRFANEALIKDLLPVIDNLERAVEHAKGGGNGKPLVEGVEMVLKGFIDILIKHGVKQITAVGAPFDPEKHEAMAQVETHGHEPNTVIEEHHKGYLLMDRLLRPSLVSVAKEPESKEKKNENKEVEKGPPDD